MKPWSTPAGVLGGWASKVSPVSSPASDPGVAASTMVKILVQGVEGGGKNSKSAPFPTVTASGVLGRIWLDLCAVGWRLFSAPCPVCKHFDSDTGCHPQSWGGKKKMNPPHLLGPAGLPTRLQ